MPVTKFAVKWPKGGTEICYSPSSVIKEYLEPGIAYTPEVFLHQCEKALKIASERVEAKYGFACSGAYEQLERIRLRCREFITFYADEHLSIIVEKFFTDELADRD
ncbi:MSMEG_0570 family nitrogen starvation response protein [Vibrio mangrovi]|uniref:MSMEG_0570 family nitrogen starvation response protein n=1 Tax=Vibrio mangrovi TaxID=474394 RepID=A0A1Y6IY83_9VIBR|nr:MSMEG_0570 family nitrogen starvation response protein [Vibrio mangrovi]MDW6005161.1 MSMEG_0570 family nitrogen starvation response protein [Vibrio mangrovi]SMS02629.1 hypothetical protein VIM7927_03963 [Vibrio mangrovi]